MIQYTDDQRETARAINDFTLFMESWTKTVAENNDLKIQLSSMQQQIHLLDHKIDDKTLTKQNKDLQKSLDKLNSLRKQQSKIIFLITRLLMIIYNCN